MMPPIGDPVEARDMANVRLLREYYPMTAKAGAKIEPQETPNRMP